MRDRCNKYLNMVFKENTMVVFFYKYFFNSNFIFMNKNYLFIYLF